MVPSVEMEVVSRPSVMIPMPELYTMLGLFSGSNSSGNYFMLHRRMNVSCVHLLQDFTVGSPVGSSQFFYEL